MGKAPKAPAQNREITKLKTKIEQKTPNLSFLSGRKAKFSCNKAVPRWLPKRGEVFFQEHGAERKESASLEKSQDSCFCPRQLPEAPRNTSQRHRIHLKAAGASAEHVTIPAFPAIPAIPAALPGPRRCPSAGTWPGTARGDFGESSGAIART